jgi:hypothetical protein
VRVVESAPQCCRSAADSQRTNKRVGWPASPAPVLPGATSGTLKAVLGWTA